MLLLLGLFPNIFWFGVLALEVGKLSTRKCGAVQNNCKSPIDIFVQKTGNPEFARCIPSASIKASPSCEVDDVSILFSKPGLIGASTISTAGWRSL
jgi:hypothetical protein